MKDNILDKLVNCKKDKKVVKGFGKQKYIWLPTKEKCYKFTEKLINKMNMYEHNITNVHFCGSYSGGIGITIKNNNLKICIEVEEKETELIAKLIDSIKLAHLRCDTFYKNIDSIINIMIQNKILLPKTKGGKNVKRTK
jgi:hypothetical protein